MIIFLILVAFGCGAVYGYSKSIEHCDKCHDGNDKNVTRFKGPY